MVGASPTPTSARCTQAYDVLGCLPPTYEPRATGHIPEMVELIRQLIDKGHAYAAADGSRRRLLRREVLAGVRLAVGPAARRHGGRRGRRPARQARPARLRALEGPQARRAGDRRRGRRRGVAAGRAGTSSARRWRASTSATRSTSTAAASTCGSRTTRTSWPSRRAAGQRFAQLLDAQRLDHRVRREDEQVARQLDARHRGGQAGAADRAALLPGRVALPLASSSSRTRRSTRPAPRSGGSRASSRGPSSWSATVDSRRRRCPPAFADGDGRRPGGAGGAGRRARDGPRRQQGCSPTATPTAWRPRPRRSARRCSAIFGLDPLAEPWASRAARRRRGDSDVIDALVAGAARAARRRRGRARTSPPRTPSATSCATAGVEVEDTPQGPRWTVRS